MELNHPFSKRLRILADRERFNSELEEEMAFHREQIKQDLQDGGLPADAAQHAAHRQFGTHRKLSQQSHQVVGFRVESIMQDFHFAIRQLRKNPGFACTAILVLALGTAACISIFAFVDAALLKPLPYQNPSRLVGVFESATFCSRCNLSYQDYLDWKKENTVFHSLDAWGFNDYLWKSPAGVEPVPGVRTSGSFFRTLGVTAMLGRTFNESDDTPSAARTVLLSYHAWQTRFGGREDIEASQ